MDKSLLNRVQVTTMALATAALILLAVFNLLQERAFQQPTDGVWWHETRGGLVADRVLPGSPGQQAFIQAHDLLTAVNDDPIATVADLERALYRAGPYVQLHYSITRDGIPLDTPVQVIPVPADRSLQIGLRIIGLIYLVIGFYVLFRRWGAPRVHAFLSLLPGLVCALRASLHRRLQSARLDRLLDQRGCRSAAAGALSPLRPQLS